MARRKTVVFKQQSMKYTESMNESGFIYTNEPSAVDASGHKAVEDINQSFNNCIGAGIGGFMQQNENAIAEFDADDSQIKIMDGEHNVDVIMTKQT